MRPIRLLISLLALAAVMLVPATAGAQTANDPCPAFNFSQGSEATSTCATLPHFKASFINRVWTFDGAVDEVDLEAHTLEMTTWGIENLPARFKSQDDDLLDQDTRVLFKSSTRVYDPDGRRVTQDYLTYADNVAVRGKLVAPRRWAEDEDGVKIPTVSAKRLYILDYIDDASEAQDEDAAAEAADPSAQDPTGDDGVVTTADVEVWISIYLHIRLRG